MSGGKKSNLDTVSWRKTWAELTHMLCEHEEQLKWRCMPLSQWEEQSSQFERRRTLVETGHPVCQICVAVICVSCDRYRGCTDQQDNSSAGYRRRPRGAGTPLFPLRVGAHVSISEREDFSEDPQLGVELPQCILYSVAIE